MLELSDMDLMLRQLARIPGARSLWIQMPIGSVETRVRYGIWKRPQYAYGVLVAAKLARTLNINSISVIEFGVAGGRGLVQLERIAEQVGREHGVSISVFGFDSGGGMPDPVDYRDLPHVWQEGFFSHGRREIKTGTEIRHSDRRRYRRDHILLLSQTHPPIGFISFDLDYYSSTKKAFRLFDAPGYTRLPRVYCYFDDILSSELVCHCEYAGELLAIREFNEEHERQKICPAPIYSGICQVLPQRWNDQIYVMHDFDHAQYCDPVRLSSQDGEMPL